jgi:hypothetical protein
MACKQSEHEMNDITKPLQPDRSKINVDAPDELNYWAKGLGVSKEEILRSRKGRQLSYDRPKGTWHLGQRALTKPNDPNGVASGGVWIRWFGESEFPRQKRYREECLMRHKSVGSRKKVRKITHTNGISKGEVGQVL